MQLPLPDGADDNIVRNVIPVGKDVDVISDEAIRLFERGESLVLPPVVGAIAEITKQYHVTLKGKKILVVGEGRLVGKPVVAWLRAQLVSPTLIKDSINLKRQAKDADVIILGTGSPGLLMPDMLKDGVMVFDAGTSETAGKLAGDADPSCATKASLFTPVPGGIGPVTVAMIFKNLLALAEKGQRSTGNASLLE